MIFPYIQTDETNKPEIIETVIGNCYVFGNNLANVFIHVNTPHTYLCDWYAFCCCCFFLFHSTNASDCVIMA